MSVWSLLIATTLWGRDEIQLEARTPLFVMADTRGEFEIAAQLLQRHGIIDDRLRWSFGKGPLALLGDVFDRGPNHTELLWLIYKLELEATRAGDGVHLARVDRSWTDFAGGR